jgi:hypothetical protein
MDDLPASNQSQPDLKDLQVQCDALQQLVSSLLLVLIVVSGTLSIFLLRQWRFVQTEADALAPQAAQLMMEHTNNYAMTQDFVKKMAEYGRGHPDFSQIVAKYHLNDLLPKPGTTPLTSSIPTSASRPK